MRVLCTFLLALLLPAIAFGANFATQTLFLSKSNVTEGETVLVHTTVTHSSESAFSGKLTITDGGNEVGTAVVTLARGEAEVVSVSWQPTAGEHTLLATLVADSGEVVEETRATFTIAASAPEKEENTPSSSSAVGSSEAIQKGLADISPGVANASEPVFESIDSLRATAAAALDKGKEWAKKSSSGGSVMGTSTEGGAQGGIVSSVSRLLSSVVYYIFAFLSYLIKNPALFYPLFAVAFIYGLWRLYQRMRGPRF